MEKSKYNSLKEWCKADYLAVANAKKQGVLLEICKMFGWKLSKEEARLKEEAMFKELSDKYGEFTIEDCLEDALKYSCRGLWRLKSYKYYFITYKMNWFVECTAHMSEEVWDYESCLSEAKLYPINWSSKSPNSYSAANKYNYIEKIYAETNRTFFVKDLSKEECFLQALNFKFESRWKQNHATSYRIAKNNGWLLECTAHMEKIKKPTNRRKNYKFTKEECLETALKHQYRSHWFRENQSMCAQAKENGWYDECIAHMNKKIEPRTKEECLIVALKCETKTEFQKLYNWAYSASIKYGWYDECTAHMKIIVTPPRWKNYKFTKEECLEAALKHEYKNNWRKENQSMVKQAKENGWFDECTAHMNKKKYTKEECLESALKHEYKNNWCEKNYSMIRQVKENGWYDECIAHMRNKKKYTKEECLESALKNEYRSIWEKSDHSIVDYAKKNGWYDECTAHMPENNAKPAFHWTLERVLESTKGHDTFSSWLKANRGAYKASRVNDWTDRVKACFSNVRTVIRNVKKYTKEECLKTALKYQYRSHWGDGKSGMVKQAKENGWYDECTAHMKIIKKT